MVMLWLCCVKQGHLSRVDLTFHKYQHALEGKLLITKAINQVLLSC